MGFNCKLSTNIAEGNKIGKKRTIGLTVRSRSKDGLLYYIGRLKYDYVVIELVKGEVFIICFHILISISTG